jgi:hypothetical protein
LSRIKIRSNCRRAEADRCTHGASWLVVFDHLSRRGPPKGIVGQAAR